MPPPCAPLPRVYRTYVGESGVGIAGDGMCATMLWHCKHHRGKPTMQDPQPPTQATPCVSLSQPLLTPPPCTTSLLSSLDLCPFVSSYRGLHFAPRPCVPIWKLRFLPFSRFQIWLFQFLDSDVHWRVFCIYWASWVVCYTQIALPSFASLTWHV